MLFVSINSNSDGKEKDQVPKKSKKKDRFEGVPITNILQKKLPDHLAPNLDLLFVCLSKHLFFLDATFNPKSILEVYGLLRYDVIS